MEELNFPIRINKYLAAKRSCTRREADELIEKGRVLINGKTAMLGNKVEKGDKVEVRFRVKKEE
jgi:23S rRNA pseudouridine2604 synthase